MPAPASGATSRNPSRTDWSTPFASPSNSSGSIALSIAERAAASAGAEDPEVAADALAAHDERRPVAGCGRGVAAERNLGAEVAGYRACVDVEVRAGLDADLDVARDALQGDAALAHGLEANVAGYRLRLDRAADRADGGVARHGREL